MTKIKNADHYCDCLYPSGGVFCGHCGKYICGSCGGVMRKEHAGSYWTED